MLSLVHRIQDYLPLSTVCTCIALLLLLYRFSPEEKSRRDPMTYLPFGEGPRNCIASRFALEQVKIALCHILNEFRVFRVFETAVSCQHLIFSCKL